jgi:hypothetical protein
MADNISEILSPEGERQLDALNDGLELAIQNITKFGQVAKGITVEFKGVKDFATLNELQNKVKETTEKMTKAQRDFADEIDRAQVREQAAVAKALAGYERQAAAAEKSNAAREKAAQRAANEAEKAAAREAKAIGQLTNDYELLKKAYTDAANKAKELGVTFGTNSKVFKDAAANAKVMYDRLLKVEMAVGQGQRAVGQYNQAAFAMQQILRETPAFAYSFATGISAIANNIPILVDEINRMKAANADLVASGGKAVPIWKELWKSILSPMGLLTLGIGAFTIFTARMSMHTNGMKTATDVGKKYADTLKEIDENAASAAAKEGANVKSLIGVAQNLSLSMNVRLKAVKDLQDQYPDYLGNLSKEKILTGDLTTEVQSLNKALMAKGMYQASTEKIGAAYTKIFDAEIQLTKLQTEFERQMAEMRKKGIDPNKYGEATFLNIEGRKAPFIKQIEEAKKQISEFQKLADKYAAEAGGTLFGKDKKGGKTKSTDTTLKSESELLKAEYELSKQRVEQDAQIQKEIADNEKNTINQRLDAYMEYQADLFQLLRMAKDYELNQEGLKIQDIKRKKKTATATELIALQDQEDAANKRATGIKEKFQNDLSDVERKGNKDRLAILNTGNEQWIKSEEFRNAKLKEQQVTWYLTQEALLKKALDAKEITTKEYNTRLRNLQKQEGQMLLDDDIELYTRLLQNKTLSAEKQLEIQNKLNAALKQKSQGGAADAGKRPSGRLTDGLATSLGITDESEQQAFYDASINLANQAADAIISANRRQYEAEMAMLDRKREAIQTNYDLQMNLIDATSKTEEEYAERVAKLNSQRAEQEAAIEQQKKEAAIKQARFEKAAAIASIIQNTAVAIASALKLGPAAPFVVALIAAAGAAQLASVASAPIPAYKEGTDYHKGGAFIAGDGGAPELIAPPNKAPYWSASTSTLYNESAGTKVIPIDKYLKNVDATGGYRIGSVNAAGGEQAYRYMVDAINNGFSETGEALALSWAQIARANRPNINMNALAEEMRRERNLQGK